MKMNGEIIAQNKVDLIHGLHHDIKKSKDIMMQQVTDNDILNGNFYFCLVTVVKLKKVLL